MKHGSGMKGREDRSSGIEIPMTDVFVKIKPTDPFRFVQQTVRRKGINQANLLLSCEANEN
jgi:hypothetical protein